LVFHGDKNLLPRRLPPAGAPTHSRVSSLQFREIIDQARLLSALPNLAPDMITSFPGLAWVKEYKPETREYLMLILSEQYVRNLLGPKVLHYVGKSDFSFWPEPVALAFYSGDERARLDGDAWVEEEFASPLTGESCVFVGAKWSFKSSGSTFVAGAGRAIMNNA